MQTETKIEEEFLKKLKALLADMAKEQNFQ